MDDEKKKLVEHLRDTARLFSKEGRCESESWIVSTLLHAVGVSFYEGELQHNDEEDHEVDVVFREARFQTKTLPDPGRKPHREYLERANALEASNKEREQLSHLEPNRVSLQQAMEQARAFLQKISADDKYSPETRGTTDLVLYINLNKNFLKPGLSSSPVPEYVFDLG
jgi:hypothetical protein